MTDAEPDLPECPDGRWGVRCSPGDPCRCVRCGDKIPESNLPEPDSECERCGSRVGKLGVCRNHCAQGVLPGREHLPERDATHRTWPMGPCGFDCENSGRHRYCTVHPPVTESPLDAPPHPHLAWADYVEHLEATTDRLRAERDHYKAGSDAGLRGVETIRELRAALTEAKDSLQHAANIAYNLAQRSGAMLTPDRAYWKEAGERWDAVLTKAKEALNVSSDIERAFPIRWKVRVHVLPSMRTKRASPYIEDEHEAWERYRVLRRQYPDHLTTLAYQRCIDGRWTSDQVDESGTGALADGPCPDGGTCHHRCGDGKCWRVGSCAPLASYGDDWTDEVKAAHAMTGRQYPLSSELESAARDALERYWDLPECCQERIRQKCQWEQMSISGVMRDWPNLRCEDHG